MENEQECLVQIVEVAFDGTLHRASFFVEDGIVHALFGGRTMGFPIGTITAADTVKALLVQNLTQQKREACLPQRRLSLIKKTDQPSTPRRSYRRLSSFGRTHST